jgi:glycosyltransferase involved in cell wall biosynthesis
MAAELDDDISHSSAASVGQTWLALAAIGRVGLVHAHMTAAEVAAVCCRVPNRAPVVATRHFPHERGSSMLGRIARTVVYRSLAEQIANSRFVADRIEEPSVVIHNGVPSRPQAELGARRVLMMQRLEHEKAPEIGVVAWAKSGLAGHGWEFAIAGTGRLEPRIRRMSGELGVGGSVQFLGNVEDTDSVLAETSILLAPAPADSFGLAVVEAMAHGIPVVAAGGGGHRETIGPDGCLFPPGDAQEAASCLARLGNDQSLRRLVGERLRARQRRLFAIDLHVERLQQVYASVLSRAQSRQRC